MAYPITDLAAPENLTLDPPNVVTNTLAEQDQMRNSPILLVRITAALGVTATRVINETPNIPIGDRVLLETCVEIANDESLLQNLAKKVRALGVSSGAFAYIPPVPVDPATIDSVINGQIPDAVIYGLLQAMIGNIEFLNGVLYEVRLRR